MTPRREIEGNDTKVHDLLYGVANEIEMSTSNNNLGLCKQLGGGSDVNIPEYRNIRLGQLATSRRVLVLICFHVMT